MAPLTHQKVEAIVKRAWKKGDRPDLRGMNLRGVNLAGMNLRGAYLSGADLRGADLRLANLHDAELVRADLSQADLTGADLSQAGLTEAVLSEANLTKADLSEAGLEGVNLHQAYLERANLHRAYLEGVNLHDAELVRADLSQADLTGADLSRANLTEADLTGAALGGTRLEEINLQVVRGLDAVEHLSPSHIDTHTLTLSQGQIPEIFLRGCGLSDTQIEMAKLHDPNLTPEQITDITRKINGFLTDNFIQIAPCFISYASPDRALAERLYNDLQHNGVRCWYAPDKLKGGQTLESQIDEAILLHDVFLLILSEASMRSKWVKKEITKAISGKTLAKILDDKVSKTSRLFPIRLVDFEKIEEIWAEYDYGTDIREYYIPDFSQWQDPAAYKKSFERLLRDLRAGTLLNISSK